MALRGEAFVAIWNDADASGVAEYDSWHQTQRVPRRLTVPGILAARRYEAPSAPRHRFFTLWEMTDLGVFATVAYREVAEELTARTLQMRSLLRNVQRLPCRLLASHGCGVFGSAGAVAFRLPKGGAHPGRLVESLVGEPAIAALHLGIVDEALGRLWPKPPPDGCNGYALVIEAVNGACAAAGLAAALYWLHQAGARIGSSQSYTLVSALRQEEVLGLLPQEDREPA